MSRDEFIAVEKARHAVVRLCRVLGVAKSAFYARQHQQPSARTRADAELVEQIRAVHAASNCTYGAPRVQAELRRRGARVARKRVARLMRTAGLVGRRRRAFRRTTVPDATTPTRDLVQRQFRPAAPDQLWVADVTYVRTWEGWLYLAVILDAFSRRVVGWALADHLRTELPLAALQMALQYRQPEPGVIHHSDRGVQYVSGAYQEVLAKYCVRQSVGRPGTAWDNAVAESFFATLKQELLHRAAWPTRRAARTAIFGFIEGWYNRARLHSTLHYCSPTAYEEAYHRLTTAA
jgi:putative transposase